MQGSKTDTQISEIDLQLILKDKKEEKERRNNFINQKMLLNKVRFGHLPPYTSLTQ